MALPQGPHSFDAKQILKVGQKSYTYFSIPKAAESLGDFDRWPYSLKVLLENLLRHEDGKSVVKKDIEAMARWGEKKRSDAEIAYHPARVVMQDFTGVPAVVDLAVMRDAVKAWGGDAQRINPQVPVDLVIDHSVQVDHFGSKEAFQKNVELEYVRNRERYEFLKWGAKAFDNFRVVPPGTGIIHQVNLESLAQVVWTKEEESGETVAYCDTCVGTDSHTTMINGLSVLGWGVGGIEAEAAMLGQAVTMTVPEVVGFRLDGRLREGVTATDLVLQIVQNLRAFGVVGKFVEFYGPGLDHLSLADRATIANMAPEYGATCGFFPIDEEVIRYLRFTGREESRVLLVEEYAKAQGLWRDQNSPEPLFTSTLELDLKEVSPCLAGHKRPQDRIPLEEVKKEFQSVLKESFRVQKIRSTPLKGERGEEGRLSDGDVAIAAITSCTNTSNPSVMVAAGLVAAKAFELGLRVKPWVKTSMAPGSQVVGEYLKAAGLLEPLEKMGFHIVGYGCTTCIGNSGPLPEDISQAVEKGDLVVASVLSGNRNFEGRISPQVKANFLASPPLVVAYALAGSVDVDLTTEPLGRDGEGKEVYLKDIWPSNLEIADTLAHCLDSKMFIDKYADVFCGDGRWRKVAESGGETYRWKEESTYVRCPPYFEGMKRETDAPKDILSARPLAILGDSVTTDHISPAGPIHKDSPAGLYLKERGVEIQAFNSYGSRRGNHEVMMRGTFANIRLRNLMAPGTEGGWTKKWPEGKESPLFDAAMEYQKQGIPLVVVAGREYGTGSSRDWAAKGTALLGVKAVMAQSFERIHRSNLIGMGVLPLEFPDGADVEGLQLQGNEVFDIMGIEELVPRGQVLVKIHRKNGEEDQIEMNCRLDTQGELDYYRHGGILHYVLRGLSDR
ncbi:MAG: aconitate hydratase AcnA [Bacteriovoracales bacterium]|nr:aconitate hydratase AcnA [Bacteriovoracales bacterium]